MSFLLFCHRLLELRLSELEAPFSPNDSSIKPGTGSLESDLALLARHHEALQAPQTSEPASSGQQPSQQQGSPQGEGLLLPHRKHCAVVYRAGQKQVIRAFAVGAREELSRIMRLLRAVDNVMS